MTVSIPPWLRAMPRARTQGGSARALARWCLRPRPLLLAVLAVLLTITAVRALTAGIYLTSDGGHYLADADALGGQGVREIRHLPGFPAVLLVLHAVAGDLVALDLAMGLVLVALVAGFYVFVRGRAGHPLAEVAGTALFAMSPVIAEGVGWYGSSMMLGLAASLVAMRLIDDAVSVPRLRTAVAAGIATAAVAMTHPFSLVFLAEVSALAVAMRGVAAVVRRHRDALCVRSLAPVAGAATCICAFALAAVALEHAFYLSVDNPLVLHPDLSRLSLLRDWAYRDDSALWLAILAGGIGMLPAGWLLARERGLVLGIWATAIAAVAFANVVAFEGHASYVTRSLYPLAATLGTTFAFGVALANRVASRRHLRTAGASVLVALAVAGCLGVAGHAYLTRLDAAVAYYDTVTGDELTAIRWFDGRSGAVVVTAKGDDVEAGTLYSWMIEGLAHVPAWGTGEDVFDLLGAARAETKDAEAVIGGDTARARARNVRYIFTWRSTGLLDTLVARPCSELAYATHDVAIVAVDPFCQAR